MNKRLPVGERGGLEGGKLSAKKVAERGLLRWVDLGGEVGEGGGGEGGRAGAGLEVGGIGVGRGFWLRSRRGWDRGLEG